MPIPEGFPDAEAIDEASGIRRERGVVLDVGRQAERFRQHALSNDRRLRDWRAGWRNWIGIACDDASPEPSRAQVADRAPWAGPAALRAAVVRQMDESWAAGWFDQARYQEVPVKALLVGRRLTLTRLTQEIGPLLSDWGIELRLAETAA